MESDSVIINLYQNCIRGRRKSVSNFHNETPVGDLPRFGVRQWQVQFMKTFNIFTKLWKYQAENRLVLIEHANLKRHEIGEIASRVGQLYYHYYLHTSDPKYLTESCEFYAAIVSRQYFQQTKDKFDMSVALKSFRCTARYLVVALLLRDYDLMVELIEKIQEDANHVGGIDIQSYDTWNIVVKEAKLFMNCEHFLAVVDISMEEVEIKYRLAKSFKGIDGYGNIDDTKLKLQTAIIISGCEKQVKLSELTLDMYRMLLLLEYEYKKGVKFENEEKKLKNPKRHLLYKPTFSQIYAYLAAVFKDLESNGILLVYISGDSEQPDTHGIQQEVYCNGVSTSSSSALPLKTKSKNRTNPALIYPEDLIPFTRKPLVVIVDTNNSTCFESLPDIFKQPLLCLMSPTHMLNINRKSGSLFTTFLLDPLLGVCQLCKINRMPIHVWEQCQSHLKKIESQCIQVLLQESKNTTMVFSQLLYDPFLYKIVSNFLICWMVLRLFKETERLRNLPSSSPPISKEVLEHKVFFRHLLDIMSILGVRTMFYEALELPPLKVE